MKAFIHCVVGSLAIAGCGSSRSDAGPTPASDNSSEKSSAPCRDVERRPLQPGESTPAGTVSDVIASALGARSTTVRYWTHGETQTFTDSELTMELTADGGSGHFVVQEAVAPGSDFVCPTRIEVDAALRFVSSDGAFDETFRGILWGDEQGSQFDGSLPAADIRGSYNVREVAKFYVAPQFDLQSRFQPSLRGDIDMSGGDPDNDPNTTIVSAAIAQWPASR